MATEIDSLQISIETVANDAAKPIDRLVSSIESLRNSARGGAGLGTWVRQISSLRDAANGIQANRLNELVRVFASLSAVQKPTGLSSAVRALTNLKNIDLSNVSADKLRELANALNILGNVEKATGFTSTVNSLKKLPEVAASLANMDMGALADQIQRLTDSLAPLAERMQQIASGFSAFPNRIQRFIQSSEACTSSNTRNARSFGDLNRYVNRALRSFGFLGTGISRSIARAGIFGVVFRRIANILGNWVEESNSYVENLNLFTVSMGDAAQSAMEYAEVVKEAVGIDPSDWMRNQGLFKQITSGFGVAQEKANLMSKNLTQLGYDISSFYNISTEEAMQKLQSAISGELEPVRRLGYAIDVATLRQVAYNHGITQSVNTMNQAQKSQLRYVALMEQSGNVMGDMARTVISPANSMRILKQEITQLARALGNMLVPALQAIIPIVQAVVQVLTMAAQAIANFFGFQLPSIDYSGLSVGGIADDAENLDDALSGAAGSAKDLKRQLIGIDELTVLNAPDAGGGGGAGVGGLGGDLGLELPEYDFLDQLAETQAGKIKEHILSLFEEIKDAIMAGDWAGAGGILASKINDLFGNVPFEDIGRKLGEVLQHGIEFSLGFIRQLDVESFGRDIASFVNGLLEKISPQDIGALLATRIRMIVDFAYGIVTTFKWSEFGTWLSGVVNGWFAEIDEMKIAETISVAIKGALEAVQTLLSEADFVSIGEKIGALLTNIDWFGIFTEALKATGGLVRGLAEAIVGTLKGADWASLIPDIAGIVGLDLIRRLLMAAIHPLRTFRAVSRMFGSSGTADSAGQLASATGSLSEATGGLNRNLVSLAKNLGVGIVIIGEVAVAAGLIAGAIWGLGALLEQVGLAWEPVIENAAVVSTAMWVGTALLTSVGVVTGVLGTSGKTLLVNMAAGAAILLEIGVSAGLFVGEIWALGVLLEQVGLAWDPVIANGETIITAIEIGTGVLVGIGVVAGLLGVATTATGGAIPLAIGIGAAMLIELGAAAAIFIAEIWGIGKALDEVGKAWQPVLDNGETIKTAILTGTGLLVAVGAAAGALGIARVASFGLLDVAIDAGTGMLKKLSNATISFTDSLSSVADEMTNRLAPSLASFNAILPGLSSDMAAFKDYMIEFAGFVVEYSKDSSVSAIASTIETIIDWFTKDPLENLASDVEKNYTQASKLNEKLNLAVPELKAAAEMLGDYTSFVEDIREITASTDASDIKDAVFADMKEVGKSLSTGFAEGISENWSAVSGFFAESLPGITTEITDWIDDTKTSISLHAAGMADPISLEITSEVMGVVSAAWSWGSDISASIADGISYGTQWVIAAVANLANWIYAYLHFSEPDVGPLKDFHTYMPDMLQEMATGIRENERAVIGPIQDLSADIAREIGTIDPGQIDISGSATFNVDRGSSRYEDGYDEQGQDIIGGMRENNEDLISVILGAAQQIITAINEKDMTVSMDGRNIVTGVNDAQTRLSRRLGHSPSYV